MGEFPDLTIIIIEDLVLTVVVYHVVSHQLIVNDCGSDGFLILFDLLLSLKLLLNVSLHR